MKANIQKPLDNLIRHWRARLQWCEDRRQYLLLQSLIDHFACNSVLHFHVYRHLTYLFSQAFRIIKSYPRMFIISVGHFHFLLSFYPASKHANLKISTTEMAITRRNRRNTSIILINCLRQTTKTTHAIIICSSNVLNWQHSTVSLIHYECWCTIPKSGLSITLHHWTMCYVLPSYR